ncbi:hypothetical protein EVAR_87823_1 [Eumeta japonica]|uniref:Uncharacterized protein n=1 Tax=Eumeta variegata TaxID=151549 RepID=A0A4C1Z1W1_EUMVA|nr:hypothetical protein EVAR_87823_1 [Eumeta japonica]
MDDHLSDAAKTIFFSDDISLDQTDNPVCYGINNFIDINKSEAFQIRSLASGRIVNKDADSNKQVAFYKDVLGSLFSNGSSANSDEGSTSYIKQKISVALQRAVSPAAPPYAAMPINAETVNLAATYMILVILLFFLWLLYSIVF